MSSAYFLNHLEARRKQQDRRNARRPPPPPVSLQAGAPFRIQTPAPVAPARPPAPAKVYASIAAVVVGIEYTRYAAAGRLDRLPGCHHDVDVMVKLLIEKFNVDPKAIKVLADKSNAFSTTVPNKANILGALKWLTETGKQQLHFVYSGHGSWQDDTDGDEADGRDEMIVPEDFLESGFITDDMLQGEAFLGSVPAATSAVTCIFDCCHAGSMLDLAMSHTISKQGAVTLFSPGTNPVAAAAAVRANVISLSACADSQTSVSAFNLDARKLWQGALTFAYDKVIRANIPSSGGGDKMDALLLASLVSKEIEARGFSQTTTLSVSRVADNYVWPASHPQI